MTEGPLPPPDATLAAADAAWRIALARYIELARQGAGRGMLRAAATAVHQAALHKSRAALPAREAG
jgi:hypothetical protein